MDDDGLCRGADRGTPAKSKWSSKLTFITEITFVGGVALQPCESGYISVEVPFFQKAGLLLQKLFSRRVFTPHFQVAVLSYLHR